MICQTDINECTSNPCRNGASCVDGLNGFNCTCTPFWNGTLCQLDVNECAVNNGGCPQPFSFCTNSIGGFNCSSYFLPTAITALPTPQSSDPLVFASLAGVQLFFDLYLSGYPLPLLSVYNITVGDSAKPNRFTCGGLVTNGPLDTLTHTQPVTCFVGRGYGGVYNLQLWGQRNRLLVATSNATVSFPAPVILPNTLRQNRTGASNTPTTYLQLDRASLSVQICFGGLYFAPQHTLVRYGPPPDHDKYPCDLNIPASTETILCCETLANSQGNNQFLVNVGGLSSNGTDTIFFPVTPIVFRVSGCRDVGNATVDCPTSGLASDGVTPVYLTIYGLNFIQGGLSITVGGAECLSQTTSETLLTCALPASDGGAKRPVIVTAYGQASSPYELLSYAGPSVMSLFGCDVVPGSGDTTIANCNTAGGQDVTMVGTNFGAENAVVLIGSVPCVNNPINPVAHTSLVCTLPPSTGQNRPVLMLQGGGGFGSNPTISLSYHECERGTYITNLTCTPCELGAYADQTGQARCSPCIAGTYTGVDAGASACLACPAGSASIGGVSVCANCTVGTYVSGLGQPQCSLCAPGFYSAVNGSNGCLPCGKGQSQSGQGMSFCTTCDVGKFNNALGQGTCQLCTPGTYTNSTGTIDCSPCPPQQHQSQPGQGLCTLCPDGAESTAAAQSDCSQCVAGTYRDNSSVSCVNCAAGRYQSFRGTTTCVDCPVGRFSGPRAAECSPCPPGTFAPAPATQTGCPFCPSFSTSPEQSALCACAVGFYGTTRDLDMECLVCPTGAVCNATGIHFDQLIAQDGWWRSNNMSLQYFECLQASQCQNGGCAPNREGRLVPAVLAAVAIVLKPFLSVLLSQDPFVLYARKATRKTAPVSRVPNVHRAATP